MLRASAVCEHAGIPAVSLVCEGFIGQATTTSVGLGFPNLPLAVVPGHPSVQSKDELRRNIRDVTSARVIEGLMRQAAEVVLDREYGARDVVFAGTFDEVNDFFYEREWSDGLPIVPPTRDKVLSFLALVDRDPDESLKLEEMLDQSFAITDTAQRDALLQRVAEYVYEQAYFVPFQQDPGLYAVSPKVKNIGFLPSLAVQLQGAYLEE